MFLCNANAAHWDHKSSAWHLRKQADSMRLGASLAQSSGQRLVQMSEVPQREVLRDMPTPQAATLPAWRPAFCRDATGDEQIQSDWPSLSAVRQEPAGTRPRSWTTGSGRVESWLFSCPVHYNAQRLKYQAPRGWPDVVAPPRHGNLATSPDAHGQAHDD